MRSENDPSSVRCASTFLAAPRGCAACGQEIAAENGDFSVRRARTAHRAAAHDTRLTPEGEGRKMTRLRVASNSRADWQVVLCARGARASVKGCARPAFGGTSRRRSNMKNHQLSWWVTFSMIDCRRRHCPAGDRQTWQEWWTFLQFPAIMDVRKVNAEVQKCLTDDWRHL